MAIYDRFHNVVQIVSVATLADIARLGHSPHPNDLDAIAAGSFVVTELDVGELAGKSTQITHLSYLRADDGSLEISRAIAALPAQDLAGEELIMVIPARFYDHHVQVERQPAPPVLRRLATRIHVNVRSPLVVELARNAARWVATNGMAAGKEVPAKAVRSLLTSARATLRTLSVIGIVVRTEP